MSPSAVLPETTSELTNAGITSNVVDNAPSITNGASNGSMSNIATSHAELDASKLKTMLTTSPRPVPEPNSPEVMAQKTCTDHMITAKWTEAHGWEAPELKPYGPLSIMPTASVLHYATECFEGMKLYRGYDNKLRLFRPNLNAARLLRSTTRIALPAFPPTEVQKLITKLCAVDGPKWCSNPGDFLYIRPTMIANDPALGVERPKEALFYVMLCCFPTLSRPGGLKLLASQDDMCRAWPGGFGYAKLGANYGPTLVAQGEARRRGFSQVLWLWGKEGYCTESGAANFFIVWKTGEGKMQLVTPPLDDGIILDGITRRSILELSKSRLSNGWKEEDLEPIEVVERMFTMDEVVQASEEGRLVEAFAAGTAWFVAPISLIHFRGKDVNVPMGTGESGRYAAILKGWLMGIMWGKERNEWGVVVEDEGVALN